MTMTSPVELAGKTGWFDSLRRNHRNKSVSSASTNSSTLSKPISGAKSLSSLHTLTVNRSTSTPDQRLEVPKTNVATTKSLSSLRLLFLSRSKLKHSAVILNGNTTVATEPSTDTHPSVVVTAAAKEDDKNLSSAFCTLPRKRPPTLKQDSTSTSTSSVGGRSLPPIRGAGGTATTSRSRSYSIASLDRRNKRSTVWYTHSEGDFYNRNRVSLFLQAPTSRAARR